VIVIGDTERGARDDFDSLTVAATLDNPYAYRYENRPILLGRGLKWNLQTEWSKAKNWR
jgi:hypothetical protein